MMAVAPEFARGGADAPAPDLLTFYDLNGELPTFADLTPLNSQLLNPAIASALAIPLEGGGNAATESPHAAPAAQQRAAQAAAVQAAAMQGFQYPAEYGQVPQFGHAVGMQQPAQAQQYAAQLSQMQGGYGQGMGQLGPGAQLGQQGHAAYQQMQQMGVTPQGQPLYGWPGPHDAGAGMAIPPLHSAFPGRSRTATARLRSFDVAQLTRRACEPRAAGFGHYGAGWQEQGAVKRQAQEQQQGHAPPPAAAGAPRAVPGDPPRSAATACAVLSRSAGGRGASRPSAARRPRRRGPGAGARAEAPAPGLDGQAAQALCGGGGAARAEERRTKDNHAGPRPPPLAARGRARPV